MNHSSSPDYQVKLDNATRPLQNSYIPAYFVFEKGVW